MTDNPHDGSQHPRHTPEPWTVFKDEYGIPVQTRFYIKKSIATICAMNSPCLLYAKGEKDAKRIVACINACAGMEDPAAEITKLRDNQKVLVDALESIAHSVWAWPSNIAHAALDKIGKAINEL